MNVNDVLLARKIYFAWRNLNRFGFVWTDEDTASLNRKKALYCQRRAEFLKHRCNARTQERTAAALAEAQAENARLRAALEAITKSAAIAQWHSNKSPQFQHLYSKACGWSAAAEIARAALETAPAGEA